MMGKRSDFERRERDYYPTPPAAIDPLLPHLEEFEWFFTEPCAGDGRLAVYIAEQTGMLSECFDIEPQVEWVKKQDALEPFKSPLIITNPPWDRKVLHPMIEHFRQIAPTWLLFDADWMHTKQSSEYMKYCEKVVSVGRVKWFDNQTGKDNAAWYKFVSEPTSTTFIGR